MQVVNSSAAFNLYAFVRTDTCLEDSAAGHLINVIESKCHQTVRIYSPKNINTRRFAALQSSYAVDAEKRCNRKIKIQWLKNTTTTTKKQQKRRKSNENCETITGTKTKKNQKTLENGRREYGKEQNSKWESNDKMKNFNQQQQHTGFLNATTCNEI